jgi:hypothetical protein
LMKYQLKTQQERLDLTKPVSKRLNGPVSELRKVVEHVIAVGASMQGDDARAFDKDRPVVHTAVEEVKRIVTAANLAIGQTGQKAKGPATPSASSSSSSDATGAKLAMENAKFLVDNTRAALETAREDYDAAAERLITGQDALTASIAEITKVAIEGATIEREAPSLLFSIAHYFSPRSASQARSLSSRSL